MSSKPKSTPGGGCVLVLAFIVLLGIFLDAAWVLGQKAWMHAFGERTEGRIVESHSYSKKGKHGRYNVSVHTYQYRDASGVLHVEQTGLKSILFSKRRYSTYGFKEVREDAPRITVLYLRGTPSISWAVEDEPDWSSSIFLVGVVFIPMALSGIGAFFVLKPDSGPGGVRPPRAPWPPPTPPRVSPARPPPPGAKKGRKKKRGRAA
jgi:hypothetical protein